MAVGTALFSSLGGVLVERCLTGGAERLADEVAIDSNVGGKLDEDLQLWEQQSVLALFSALFAGVYIILLGRYRHQSGFPLPGWTLLSAMIALLSAVQGLLVAQAIKQYGIICRLILGTISICLCIVIEGILFSEPIALRECFGIFLVFWGSSLYHKPKAVVIASTQKSQHPSPTRLKCFGGNDNEQQKMALLPECR